MDQAWAWIMSHKGIIIGAAAALAVGGATAAGWISLDQARAILAALGLGAQ